MARRSRSAALQIIFFGALFHFISKTRTVGDSFPSVLQHSQHLIVAAAVNYDISTFSKFIIPLRKVFNGDVIILVGQTELKSRAHRALCIENRVKMKLIVRKTALGSKGDRFAAYAVECARYSWCLASDFRDVLFQADPFSAVETLPRDVDLVLFLEEDRIKMGVKSLPLCHQTSRGNCTCPYNSMWIRSCWGDGFLEKISTSTPICSGVILGTPAGFHDLSRAMLTEMKKSSKKSGCLARDQGHLNYIYHSGSLQVKTHVFRRGKGAVNTVGYISHASILEKVSLSGLVLNEDRSVSAVIHQYDRFSFLDTLAVSLSENK